MKAIRSESVIALESENDCRLKVLLKSPFKGKLFIMTSYSVNLGGVIFLIKYNIHDFCLNFKDPTHICTRSSDIFDAMQYCVLC